MAKLEEKLVNIEHKLGGTEEAPTHGDKLGWHLDYIESLIGGGGGGGDLPTPSAGDEGKALVVNSSEDGFEIGNVDLSHVTATGEIPEAIKGVIQQNGIAFGKQYIFADGLQIVDEIPEDYSGTAYYIGEPDEGIVLSEYVNGEIVFRTKLACDGLKVNDISFAQKATVWLVNDDFEELASWLDENASKLKAGDLIYSSRLEETATVIVCYPTNSILIGLTRYLLKSIVAYDYEYSDQDKEWQLHSQTETPIGGGLTKAGEITLACTTTLSAKSPTATTGTIDYTKPLVIKIKGGQSVTAMAIYGGEYSNSQWFYCRASDVGSVIFEIWQ